MIRIRFSEAEAEILEAEFRATPDRKLRDRLPIVLLAHRGRPHQDIATDLGIHRRTVPRWLNAYCAGGLDALRPKEARGQEPGIPAALADEVMGWVLGGPPSQGVDRANWTHEELADHLKRIHGIDTSRAAVQRFCSRIGIRLYRPTYRYLRGDPDKQAKAKEEIAALNKRRRRANSSRGAGTKGGSRWCLP